MKQHSIDITALRAKISKGLDLTFQRLLQQKKPKTAHLFFLKTAKSSG